MVDLNLIMGEQFNKLGWGKVYKTTDLQAPCISAQFLGYHEGIVTKGTHPILKRYILTCLGVK